MFQDGAAGRPIVDRHCSGGEIDVSVALEVHDETRVRSEVCSPIPRTRGSRDEESAVDIEHPDLDAARQPGLPSGGCDVNGRIIGEFDAHDIHDSSVERPTASPRNLPPLTVDAAVLSVAVW